MSNGGRLACTLAIVLLTGCAASNYAHQNFDETPAVTFVDPDTKQGYSIRNKPSENRMKMLLDLGGSMALLVAGKNAVPPIPLYEAAAMKFLAQAGRACTVTRSFEIIPSEVEVTYTCAAT
ncbi:MAG: hypothetical protein WC829_02230 [Hyphomicrobium sp.]